MSVDETYSERMNTLITKASTKDEVKKYYDDNAYRYDKDMVSVNADKGLRNFVVETVKYCPGAPGSIVVLDVGCGTGRIGAELKSRGFKVIDGIDPSSQSLQIAEKKTVYRKLMCQYFTDKCLNIPANTYDMILTCGTFIRGHLHPECLYEMIRLLRPGGIIGIFTRHNVFYDDVVPEYKNMIPLIENLVENGKIRKLKWDSPVFYLDDVDGIIIVLEVL